MRSFVLFTASFVLAGLSGVLGFEFQRIRKNDTMLLVVDHQIGLFELVKDFEPVEYRNNILAHATLGKVFDLPTILTTSTDDGPNGPMMQEILDMHSDAPLIRRQGEVNAWDNAEFRAAVQATGKKQVILGGIVTDVCTAFLALSLLEEGYEVFANSEASGTYSRRIADEANDRMRAAGVNVLSMFAVATDLMRDWRQTPGYPELSPYFDQYFPVYGMVERNFKAANKTA
ncbi:ycac protein [Moniliophthora roreri MCA 2997]|uniref:Ycac protein n=2 Tax=Moniliophthora roreri TaxID=221103 RepID=V2WVG5_MONRO|nr:ycac protein [Moniliophthora roreri MCA 2997]